MNEVYVKLENATLDLLNLSNEPRFFKKKIKIDTRIINDISISINKGDKLGIIGPNGSGKSTFLRLIAGIYEPTKGKIEVKGSAIGFFGDAFLNDYITGREYIYNSLLLHGLKLNKIHSLISDILDFVSLDDYIDNHIISYSEGMKARLALCSVLFSESSILLIDEGIGAGDRFFMKKTEKVIENKLKQSPILIIASHNEDILRQFCNKIIIMIKGKIIKYGDVEEVLKYYSSNEFFNKNF
jgi:ABC-2 type transport system ATP-binding protein/lipopolysaccharide transport system ATP-binding protein